MTEESQTATTDPTDEETTESAPLLRRPIPSLDAPSNNSAPKREGALRPSL